MIFLQAEHRGRRRLANPTRLARLALLALAPVTFLWAVGAALPGPRADLAALTFAPSGAMPRSAAAEAVRLIDGVVLVAPAAGRFEPAVADGATVAPVCQDVSHAQAFRRHQPASWRTPVPSGGVSVIRMDSNSGGVPQCRWQT